MKSKKTGPEKQQEKGSKKCLKYRYNRYNRYYRNTECLMIPDKDEKVYFNVDLTEPDEVYALTGYQESKIKVKILNFL